MLRLKQRVGGEKKSSKSKKQQQQLQQRSKATAAAAELMAYIPPYLRQFVHPYHGEFCATRTYHFRLLAQLMMEGFLPIATPDALLPKMHNERCVIAPLSEALHISKNVRKRSRRYHLTVNRDLDAVIDCCRKQHGSRCWLYPELVQLFRELHAAGTVQAMVFPTITTPTTMTATASSADAPSKAAASASTTTAAVRLYSIEVWSKANDDDENNNNNDDHGTWSLVAGELGYSVGSIYTSLTGFSSQNNAGSVQLAALGRLLSTMGFDMWDLGMDMVRFKIICHCMFVCGDGGRQESSHG